MDVVRAVIRALLAKLICGSGNFLDEAIWLRQNASSNEGSKAITKASRSNENCDGEATMWLLPVVSSR